MTIPTATYKKLALWVRSTPMPVVEHHEIVVSKANHFAFIASVPDVVAQRIPKIASDPPGFDRAAFHEEMNRTIVAFFKQALSDCVKH